MVCACLPAIRHLLKNVWPEAMRTIATMMSSGRTKDTGYSQSGSHQDRSKTDNKKKDYYELDERSLIANGAKGAANASNTNIRV